MKAVRLLLALSLSLSFFCSCHEKVSSSTSNGSFEDYQAYGMPELSINSHRVRAAIDSMVRNDKDELTADFRTRSYYLQDGDFLWVNRHGLNSQVDSLLRYLHSVEKFGFSPSRFCIPQIEEEIGKLRSLNFHGSQQINTILGRVEYHLTKAYLRYAVGQRFGYVNPTYIFNRVDTLKPAQDDTTKASARFRGLFDVKMEHADKWFFQTALRKVGNDSLFQLLHEIQPKGAFYTSLLKEYSEGKGDKMWRAKLLCNMERSRWRLSDYPQSHKKYILVNIPSFHLIGVDHQDTLTMRIGCGSYETKTPLLTSSILRMDVNPRWIVPRSIIEKDMIHYFSRSYCERRGFFVMDRTTGKEVPMDQVHRDMLKNPQYAVVQRGGKGNSLGRLIFRFDNNFAVYLHDTPNRDFFSKMDRGVSHGCVRVEKPFELAKFVMKEKDERLLGNLYYCMTEDSIVDKSKVVGSIKVEPQVPLFLTYYTIYPLHGYAKEGWVEYPDVYGYDRILYEFLKNNYL